MLDPDKLFDHTFDFVPPNPRQYSLPVFDFFAYIAHIEMDIAELCTHEPLDEELEQMLQNDALGG